ncbi:uncharacterized protein LOC131256046 [Magnolia sinica]|uniref:uncharacterized protein LOC131256046 n=1 Tax=Magnolia sinica TaxID=86752 RepID=UPI002657F8F8|nr:uncharacterized protein LOC131256046 [Magnolia sinica]
MSGGTPVGGGVMRHRHSQGYMSGEDLEDDASSAMPFTVPPLVRARTWVEIIEDVLWIASTAFIIYFGDRRSNFIYLLWQDERIRRKALYLGLVGTLVNVGIILYVTLLKWDARKFDDKLEVLTPFSAPIVAIVGLLSFCLLSFALWPIWGFLTLPLLFTLFMASMAVSHYLLIGSSRSQAVTFRID